ncbi:MAG: M23 family metallopeptidase [Spirochaetes bacterium]|nr:M23 family metallopeptidase [Spirochaetota bacterium]
MKKYRMAQMVKKERILMYVSLIILAVSNLSFNWPVQNIRITSTFGESRTDHFHDGIDLISFDSRVSPIADGNLLYFWNSNFFPFDQETGSGNFAVLNHKDYKSVYIHLDRIESFQPEYTSGSIIGRFANSGRSYGNHVHLGIFDKDTWSSVNALEIMPAVSDERPPVIGYFALHIGEDYIILNSNSKIRLTKNYPLLVQIFDEINPGDRLGIFSMKVLMNGEQIYDVKFDRMKSEKRTLKISDRTFDEIFDGKDYYKIPVVKYQQGINTFDVYAYDYAGNVSLKQFIVDVNLDM